MCVCGGEGRVGSGAVAGWSGEGERNQLVSFFPHPVNVLCYNDKLF